MIKRGSEWRLWNLHMHSKYSKESRTKMSVKEIFDKLIEKNIAMFSITDHSNVDSLDEIWDIYENQKNEKGYYKNQIDFIPGIEVKTDKGKKGVHLICVFPKNIKINDMILKSTKQTIYDNFCAPLGLTEGKITINGKGDYAAGLLNTTVPFDETVNLTHQLGGLVIVHGGDKHGSIENEMSHVKSNNPTPEEIYNSLELTKSEILEKKIDIIELPNHNRREAKNADFYRKEFVKPCMVASDSHTAEEYENMNERVTWVKSDCSFEGLRQALIDYDSRIFLGNTPDQILRINNNPTKYIDELKIDWTNTYDGSKGKWFQNINIPMNPGLISIIGNKGNGKSAIAEIIGLLLDSRNYNKFSFLNKTKFIKNKLATGFEASIVWKNEGEKSNKNLSESPDETKVERCQCIPQQYFEEICTDTELKKFSDEINGVIFSRLTDIDKENCRSFDELIDKYSKLIENNIGFLINDLSSINKEIIDIESKLLKSYKIKLEAEQKDLITQKDAHESIKPKKVKKPKLGKKVQERYDNIIESIKTLSEQEEKYNKELVSLNEKKRILGNVLDEIDDIENRFNKSLESIDINLKEFDLKTNDIFKLEINKKCVIEKIETIDNKIKDIDFKLHDSKDGIKKKIETCIEERDLITKEEDKNIHEYNDYLSNLEEWSKEEKKYEKDIRKIKDELNYIKDGINNDLALLYEKRINISLEIMEEKKKIISIYNKFKKPVDEFLENNEDLLNEYSICIRSGLIFEQTFEKNLFDYINKQKKNIFKDDNYQLFKTIDELEDIETIDEYLEIPEKIITKMREFPDGVISQIKDGKTLDFYNYLFGLEYLSNKYELVSDNKTLDKLSPGERGSLLLIFYLLLDLRDVPLIIDQPEDNLDNQSVAKILVPFIKAARNRRQIILVTHNPNLAVVADSDQIIHVSIDKENEQLVEVEAGGIEDEAINKAIVTILEGTMDSFRKRKQKYIE